ncbi:MAG: L-threonylcarbamoyladenylate synthase, partial [Candidatus Thorarchaeota archaeon]
PTDTAYGLTGHPKDATVVKRILTIKGRTEKLGLPLLADRFVQAQMYGTFSHAAEVFIRQFWPGAVTLIVPSRQSFPPGILGPWNSLAIRIPQHNVALAIIQAIGYPIIGTSANKSNAPSPRTADEAENQIGASVDIVVDAGPTQHSADSTIIDFTQTPPAILREGAIPRSVLEPWLQSEEIR